MLYFPILWSVTMFVRYYYYYYFLLMFCSKCMSVCYSFFSEYSQILEKMTENSQCSMLFNAQLRASWLEFCHGVCFKKKQNDNATIRWKCTSEKVPSVTDIGYGETGLPWYIVYVLPHSPTVASCGNNHMVDLTSRKSHGLRLCTETVHTSRTHYYVCGKL